PHDVLLGLLDPRAERLDDPEDRRPQKNGEAEGAPETGLLRRRSSGEVRVHGDVGDPCWLPVLPDAPGQPHAATKRGGPRGVFEMRDIPAFGVPDLDAPGHRASRLDLPEGG